MYRRYVRFFATLHCALNDKKREDVMNHFRQSIGNRLSELSFSGNFFFDLRHLHPVLLACNHNLKIGVLKYHILLYV